MSYWYVGSPYSKYPGGREEAHRVVCVETARLIAAGVPAYSPIAHTHPIAEHGGLDPYDYDIWLPADKSLMDAARGLIVLMMAGWDTSYGLAFEREVFDKSVRPVIFMFPGTVPVGVL